MNAVRRSKKASGLPRKAVSLALVCVFIVSAVITGTMALKLLNQHASNEFTGSSQTTSVILHKFEKDVEGKYTAIPVPGAKAVHVVFPRVRVAAFFSDAGICF